MQFIFWLAVHFGLIFLGTLGKPVGVDLGQWTCMQTLIEHITYAGKCTVRQAVQSVALELHICEFRLRMSDTLAIVSPAAEVSLLDGDTVLLEDATRVRDERGGTSPRPVTK
ncbi:hypothetical protein OUZ56_013723 [Daphnia magna]|uniref:Secreted protein n=1 Tax=Daphnia magna TaxID=35525 RepID=A0ABQ9Z7H3_9CRUS|nr:hypothetical protein OUZ56_013723 [Daphnia magna]